MKSLMVIANFLESISNGLHYSLSLLKPKSEAYYFNPGGILGVHLDLRWLQKTEFSVGKLVEIFRGS